MKSENAARGFERSPACCVPHARELYRRENAAFREIARPLSPFRDAHVQKETFDQLVSRTPERERFAGLKDLMPVNISRNEEMLKKQLTATRNDGPSQSS